jgi:hypothetical protein
LLKKKIKKKKIKIKKALIFVLYMHTAWAFEFK